jgi:histidinol-phosphatase (PHP family)
MFKVVLPALKRLRAGFLRASREADLIRVDYHTHNVRCGHAQGQIEDYIRAAITKGLTDVGISDHSPIYWQDGNDPMPTIAMAKDELDGYVAEVLRLKDQYADRINVRLGLESDYVEHFWRSTRSTM